MIHIYPQNKNHDTYLTISGEMRNIQLKKKSLKWASDSSGKDHPEHNFAHMALSHKPDAFVVH
jgi:hypothetical protein